MVLVYHNMTINFNEDLHIWLTCTKNDVPYSGYFCQLHQLLSLAKKF